MTSPAIGKRKAADEAAQAHDDQQLNIKRTPTKKQKHDDNDDSPKRSRRSPAVRNTIFGPYPRTPTPEILANPFSAGYSSSRESTPAVSIYLTSPEPESETEEPTATYAPAIQDIQDPHVSHAVLADQPSPKEIEAANALVELQAENTDSVQEYIEDSHDGQSSRAPSPLEPHPFARSQAVSPASTLEEINQDPAITTSGGDDRDQSGDVDANMKDSIEQASVPLSSLFPSSGDVLKALARLAAAPPRRPGQYRRLKDMAKHPMDKVRYARIDKHLLHHTKGNDPNRVVKITVPFILAATEYLHSCLEEEAKEDAEKAAKLAVEKEADEAANAAVPETNEATDAAEQEANEAATSTQQEASAAINAAEQETTEVASNAQSPLVILDGDASSINANSVIEGTFIGNDDSTVNHDADMTDLTDPTAHSIHELVDTQNEAPTVPQAAPASQQARPARATRKSSNAASAAAASKSSKADQSNWIPMEDDAGPPVRGTKNEALLSIKVKNKVTGEMKEFAFKKKKTHQIDWDSARDIESIRSWRRQIYLRGGAEKKKNVSRFHDDESAWLELYWYKILMKSRETTGPFKMPLTNEVAEDFNNFFAGRVLKDERGVDMPPRTKRVANSVSSFMTRAESTVYLIKDQCKDELIDRKADKRALSFRPEIDDEMLESYKLQKKRIDDDEIDWSDIDVELSEAEKSFITDNYHICAGCGIIPCAKGCPVPVAAPGKAPAKKQKKKWVPPKKNAPQPAVQGLTGATDNGTTTAGTAQVNAPSAAQDSGNDAEPQSCKIIDLENLPSETGDEEL